MNKLIVSAFAILFCFYAKAEVSLEQCLDSARVNYPLIEKYNLLKSTQDINLADINRGWFPKIGVYAQGSVQNVVPSFPAALSDVVQRMGGHMEGIGKVQYKIGLDLQQTIWDGGASKTQRDIERKRAKIAEAALNVDLYDIRKRVESIYFAILLIEEQIKQTNSAMSVYKANLQKMYSMVANGIAMQSDADMIEANLLELGQTLTQAISAEKGYRDMLTIFTGIDMSSEILLMPSANIPLDLTPRRPELTLFSAQMSLNSAQKKLATVSLMPKIGLFAQTYYGYPGIDYFRAMTERSLSLNALAGVKVSWNIYSFYTKNSTVKKLDISNAEIETDRNTFLFNNQLQTSSQLEHIRGLEETMKNDARIVELRGNVRKVAESQLSNGVIDATALITKINDETQARLAAAYHSIQFIQAIFNLKDNLNQ